MGVLFFFANTLRRSSRKNRSRVRGLARRLRRGLLNSFCMIHRLRIAFLLLPVSLLFAACSQRIYFPDSAPSFGFREKGHAKVLASAKLQASRASDTVEAVYGPSAPSALAVDAGYAFSRHWGVYGAYREVNNVRFGNLLSESTRYHGRRGEVGAVYSTQLGRFGALEAMAGMGFGSLERSGADAMRNYDLRFQRYSLQGALSAQTTDESFRAYFGLRLAVQHFYQFSSINPDLRNTIGYIEGLAGSQPPAYRDISTRPLGLLEPFIGFETGYRWFRIVGQTGFSARYFGPRLDALPFFVSAGIGFQWPALPARGVTEQE